MRLPSMPPQIVRLVLLTVCIVSSYLVARYCLTPASFRQYGWYRGEALNELASRQPVFAGRKSCTECHDQNDKDVVRTLRKGDHKGLSCEACHAIESDNPGVARAHADNPDIPVPPLKDAKDKMQLSGPCIRCHEANASRPKWLHQVVTKKHYAGQNCTECHPPHNPSDMQ